MNAGPSVGFMLSAALHSMAAILLVLLATSANQRPIVFGPAFLVLNSSSVADPRSKVLLPAPPSIAEGLRSALRDAMTSERAPVIAAAIKPETNAVAATEAKPKPRPTEVTSAPRPPRTQPVRINTGDIVRGVLDIPAASPAAELAHASSTEVEDYIEALRRHLADALARTPDLGVNLKAEVQVRISANGRVAAVRILKSSGDGAFDRVIFGVINGVRLAPRPAGLEELQIIPISTRAIK